MGGAGEVRGCYAGRALWMYYAGHAVLRHVSVEIRSGEVHALLGHNGAGKSTVIRLLSGVEAPSSGTIEVDGEVVRLRAPRDAQRRGLGVVHQDLNTFAQLSVGANLLRAFRPQLPQRGWRCSRGAVRRNGELVKLVEKTLRRVGLDVPLNLVAGRLEAGERKLLEIARELLQQPRYVILDEPTASLDQHSAARLLDTLRQLRSDGVGLLFVTHRLDEALDVADRFTVLRDGAAVRAGRPAREASADLLLGEIAGVQPDSAAASGNGGCRQGVKIRHKDRAGESATPGGAPGSLALSLKDVRLRPQATSFGLEVRRGEILALVGLLGSGALELAKALRGAATVAGGVLEWPNGERLPLRQVRARFLVRRGVGFIPEDRKSDALVPTMSVASNLALPAVGRRSPLGLLSSHRLAAAAEAVVADHDIRVPSPNAPMTAASGGNQQKISVLRWLAIPELAVLLAETPTHGVDVGAQTIIRQRLRRSAEEGVAVVVATYDLAEVVQFADRIAVFAQGALVAEHDLKEPDAAPASVPPAAKSSTFGSRRDEADGRGQSDGERIVWQQIAEQMTGQFARVARWAGESQGG